MAFGEEGSNSEDEARAAWQQYREQIMADLNCVGRRPAAYYKYELHIDPPGHWYHELVVLLDRNLISAEEAVRMEANNQILSGEHQESFCSALDDQAGIARMQLDPDMADELAEEFDAAARRHQWRGRSEVAERYRKRANLLRAWVADSNLPRRLKYDRNHYSA